MARGWQVACVGNLLLPPNPSAAQVPGVPGMIQQLDFICYWLILAMYESDWELEFEDSIAMRVVEGRY